MPSTTVIDGCLFKCNQKKGIAGSKIKTKICGKKYAIRKNSWFHQSHLTLFEILTLTYFWWNELPLKFIEKDLELGVLVC
jgi:hypothetical protein